jgi:predicted MFS family arabinose efflux permease
LIRTAAPSRLALTFSIKQTGVPAGAALAGAALPACALLVGWRLSLLAAALMGIAVVAAAQPIRAALDADRRRRDSLSPGTILRPLAIVWRSRTLIELALVSFIYAGTQVCLTSFLVVYLTESIAWSLVGAGFALTAATLGGVVGRIAWGMIADRVLPPRSVLGIIGIAACLCGGVLAAATPAWPTMALVVTVTLFGATAIGWNGVQLAEVARHAPPGAAGAVTGATAFITFSGVVAGPPAFALLAVLTGGYRIGLVVFAVLSGASGLFLIGTRRRGRG